MPTPEPQTVPDGSAVITPNQQYAELQALRRSVDHLAATIDPALATIRKDIGDVREDMDELREDTDANTKWRYMLTGAFVLLSALVGYGLINLTPIGG